MSDREEAQQKFTDDLANLLRSSSLTPVEAAGVMFVILHDFVCWFRESNPVPEVPHE